MISSSQSKYWYPTEEKNGTIAFYRWLRQNVYTQSTVLNLGAGPASNNPTKVLKGEIARIVGADIDPAVLKNTELDEAHVIEEGHLPFEDCSFDVVFSDYVLEHIERPTPFLREVHRVLRPGGSFLFRTPNKYHYSSMVSALTPHWFHVLVANRVRGLPGGSHDPYPTYYRFNTTRQIRRHAAQTDFPLVELRYVECEPAYLVFSGPLYLVGVLYERLVNRFGALCGLRANIFGRLTKR